MPTYYKDKGYRFFFVSYDCKEPKHVHVVKERKMCKFWATSLSKIILEKNQGMSKSDLRFIENSIATNFSTIKKMWNEHCKDTEPKTYKPKK